MKLLAAVLGAAVLTTGCVSVPTGPSTMALPGTGKPFDQFRADDGSCRQYAYELVGGRTAENAQVDSGVKSTVAGAAIGALIGGAVGGGHGAAVGAGVGGGAGALAGICAADASGYATQQRYDNAYTQCMYSRGHRVAVNGGYGYRNAVAAGYYPPPAPATTYVPTPGSYAPQPPAAPAARAYPPPPPPGSPPPNPAWIVR
jgi:hypothetical protein